MAVHNIFDIIPSGSLHLVGSLLVLVSCSALRREENAQKPETLLFAVPIHYPIILRLRPETFRDAPPLKKVSASGQQTPVPPAHTPEERLS
jgi:hypothetical protein